MSISVHSAEIERIVDFSIVYTRSEKRGEHTSVEEVEAYRVARA